MKITKMFYTYNKYNMKWEIVMAYTSNDVSDIDIISPEFIGGE